MRTLPKTRDERIGFCLLPFKTYVIAAAPLWLLLRSDGLGMVIASYHPPRLDIDSVCLGYIVALPLLLIGAFLQSLIAKRGEALWTLAFFGAGLLLFATLSPWDLIAA